MTGMKFRPPLSLILDWDGTLTRKDTLSVLSHIAESRDSRLGLDPPNTRQEQWTSFVKAYMDDYKAHEEQYTPKALERRTITAEKDWLASLRNAEYRSAHRVAESDAFIGVTAKDVDNATISALQSGEVKLRKGWDLLFDAVAQKLGNEIRIVSVNWSRALIRKTLLHAAETQDYVKANSDVKGLITQMPIHANEIEDVEGTNGSSGRLIGDIRTSADKLRYMPRPDAGKSIVIYVGDSTTDLECLLAADVGICIRDEPMGVGQNELAKTFMRLGIEVKHLGSAVNFSIGKSLLWTGHLDEIAEYVRREE